MSRRERLARFLLALVVCPACCVLRVGPGHLLRRLAGVCPSMRGQGGMDW